MLPTHRFPGGFRLARCALLIYLRSNRVIPKLISHLRREDLRGPTSTPTPVPAGPVSASVTPTAWPPPSACRRTRRPAGSALKSSNSVSAPHTPRSTRTTWRTLESDLPGRRSRRIESRSGVPAWLAVAALVALSVLASVATGHPVVFPLLFAFVVWRLLGRRPRSDFVTGRSGV